MALSKRELSGSTVLIPSGGEKIKASIAQENISHILSRLTKLYDNPVEASLREVVSNAIDATNLLPEEERKPVSISTPTIFEPQLVVEDWASGMSLDFVRNGYANYGISTKGDNVEAIGEYGLGGKSPLAYTDSFTVKTTHEGVTTIFTMQRIDGEVETDIISSEYTGETSGTRVSIPVKQEDIPLFEDATKVYSFFSWRSPVEIDGELFRGSDEYELVGKTLIYQDGDTNVYGNVRVLRSQLHEIFNSYRNSAGVSWNGSHNTSRTSFVGNLVHYELGGWIYGANAQRYDGDLPPIVVEIVPALVEFSSSRDAITSDDRLQNLNNLVDNYLRSEDFFQKLFKIFRGFNHEEIKKFSKNVSDSVLSVKDGKLFVKDYGGRVLFQGDVSLLDASIGINPYYLRSREPKRTVRVAVGWRKGEFSLFKAERQSLFSNSVNLETIFRISNLHGMYENTEIKAVSYYASALYTGEGSLILVTSATPELFKRFLRRRDAVREHFGEDVFFAFSSFPEAALEDMDITYTRNLLGKERFRIASIDTLLDELEETRKHLSRLRRSNRVAEESRALDTPLAMSKITGPLDDPLSMVSDDYAEAGIKVEYVHASLKEVMNENAVLILSSAYGWKMVYIGAVNAGEPIAGKTIYLHNERLDAAQWRFLKENKERVFIPASFDGRSKISREMVEERGFRGTVLRSALQNFTREQLLSRVLDSHFPAEPLKALLKRVPEERTLLREYISVAAEAQGKPRTFRGSEAEALEELNSRVNEQDSIDRFNRAFSDLYYRRHTSDRELMFSVLRAHHLPENDAPIVEFILDQAAKTLCELFDA